jgi:predicted AlkP superfamily pyrophosphatase or phosphodiesterase
VFSVSKSQRSSRSRRVSYHGLLAGAALLSCLGLAACKSTGTAAAPVSTDRAETAVAPGRESPARLILLIAVDQFGSAEFERLEPFFTDGFRTLIDRGVVYPRARHEHALTETGPGHATISTGRYPRHHGAVTNWWVEDGEPDLIWVSEDTEYSKSPRRLQVATLGDWMKKSHPQSKVFAAAGKARAAILLGGHKADAAFWYEEQEGHFETSTYYQEPQWFTAFSETRWLDRFHGMVWEPLPLAPEVLEQLEIVDYDWGPLKPKFPHSLGGLRPAPVENFYDDAWSTPWLDEYLGVLAAEIIQQEDLGGDEAPDLLALSFSAPDYIGHGFGTQSREYVDALLRLDQTLGKLLDLVDERVGLDHVAIALTADHGVVEAPEIRQLRGEPAHRVNWQDVQCVQQSDRQLAEKYDVERWMIVGSVLAPGLPEQTGRSRAELEEEMAELIENCPRVEEVWTRTELLAAQAGGVDRESNEELWLFANSYYPGRSADLMIRFEEYMMQSRGSVTTHGTPYLYDRQVPAIFVGPGIAADRRDDYLATIDIAPTLAGLSGVAVTDEVDGRNLAGQLLP